MSNPAKQSSRKDVTDEVRSISSTSYDYDIVTYVGAFFISFLPTVFISAVFGGSLAISLIVAVILGLVAAHLTNVYFLCESTAKLVCDSLNPTSKEKAELERTILKSLLFLKRESIKLPSRDVRVSGRSDYENKCGKGFVAADPFSATHIQDRLVVISNFGAREYLTTRPNALAVWDDAIAALIKKDEGSADTLNLAKTKV